MWSLNRAIEVAMMLTLPAAVALLVVPLPIVQILFERGAFGPDATRATAMALTAFAVGLPAFVLVKSISPAFFAREDTTTPFRYAIVAMVTDFDAWHDESNHLDVPALLKVMHDNASRVQRLIARLARDFPAEHEPCPVGSDRALEYAIVTAPEARDPALVAKLDAVAGRVLNRGAKS